MKPLDVDILNQEVLDHLNILKQEFYDCKEQYGLELSGKSTICD